jgi:hypothetical protein
MVRVAGREAGADEGADAGAVAGDFAVEVAWAKAGELTASIVINAYVMSLGMGFS